MAHYLTEAEREVRRLQNRNRELGRYLLPASTSYRFTIDDGEYDVEVVVATAGPGLIWETVLAEAVRSFHRLRGDVQASWINIETVKPGSFSWRIGRWVGHVEVTTSRGDQLDVWVAKDNDDDEE